MHFGSLLCRLRSLEVMTRLALVVKAIIEVQSDETRPVLSGGI
jgi:hypothetical protein